MKKPIRALILAGGYGTRLRPLTLKTPKCLVDIGGEPLLERWLRNLERCGCTEALINTHYLAEQVEDYLSEREEGKMTVTTVHEDKLLGTAGTLIANKNFFSNCTCIMLHADNATDFELNDLIKAHEQKPKDCVMTMLTFDSRQPTKCGIVELNDQGVVKAFHEKVNNPPGRCANAAVYAFDSSFIQYVIEQFPKAEDFSTDVLPNLNSLIATHHTMTDFWDIGTLENLKQAQKIWGNIA